MAHLHVTSLSLRGHVHTQKYMGVSEMGYIPSRATLMGKMMERHSIWRYNIFSVKPRSVYVSIDPQCLTALTLVCGLKKHVGEPTVCNMDIHGMDDHQQGNHV